MAALTWDLERAEAVRQAYRLGYIDDQAYRFEMRGQTEAVLCVSCQKIHGPSNFDHRGRCELKQVEELEKQEAIEKKHDRNIRKLYWERYLQK
jgi:hypothetical protein